jgi:hypothetical protein
VRTATFWITELDGTFWPYTSAVEASHVAGHWVDRPGHTVGLVAYAVTVELPDEES